MATVSVTFRLDRQQIQSVLASPSGPIAADLLRRANRVRNAAVRLAPVDTGVLRSSITVELVTDNGVPVARVGTNVPYARWVEEGTGIYGPRGVPIRPRTARFLRFPVINNQYPVTGGPRRYRRGSTARYAYARQVRGRKGTPFLAPALKAAAD